MHKKNKRKVLNILLIPDNESPPKNYRIRYSTVNLVAVIAVLFLVSIVIGLVTYSRILHTALEKNSMERENVQLREQLKKINYLQSELNLLKTYNEKVRNSLQGYIKFADDSEQQGRSAEEPTDKMPFKTSLFTGVPLKTPVLGFVSQEFNWPAHNGIDIVAKVGTPIKAAADGTVLFSDWTFDGGYTVILHHPNDYLTFYWHNAQNLVSENQVVKQGDVIALLGNSGESSSGPHLHFEIWKNGIQFNPRQFLLDLNAGE